MIKQAIVLAAGEGTRMKSQTPKVLHEISGRSLLGHVLHALESVEPEKIRVVVGSGRELVESHLSQIAPDAIAVVAIGMMAAYSVGGIGEARMPPGLRRPLWLAGGVLYIGLPCAGLAWFRSEAFGEFSGVVTIWLFLTVWAVDIGGYVFGRSLGGPKLAPRISPNKTWSGLIGGVICAAILAYLAATYLRFPPWQFIVCGAVLGVVEQVGDLLESWIKRRFLVKDMGNLIPGHGGLFDRVDGLLAVSFVVVAAKLAVGDVG